MGWEVTESMSVAQQEQAIILGELRGQTKELIHSVNNLHSKVDGMSKEVMAVTFLATEISDLKIRTAQIDSRLAVQEALNNHSAGMKDAITTLVKSPVFAWLFILAAAAYAVIKKGAL